MPDEAKFCRVCGSSDLVRIDQGPRRGHRARTVAAALAAAVLAALFLGLFSARSAHTRIYVPEPVSVSLGNAPWNALLDTVSSMTMDSDKVRAVEAFVGSRRQALSTPPISSQSVRSITGGMTMDSGKHSVLVALAPFVGDRTTGGRLNPWPAVAATIDSMTMDAQKTGAIEGFIEARKRLLDKDARLDAATYRRIIDGMTFDSEKQRALRLLAPYLGS